MTSKNLIWLKKKNRIKSRLKLGRFPRLIVFRSNTNIYAQIFDDINKKTLFSCSSIDKDLKNDIKKTKNKIDQSIFVGEKLSAKLKEAKINKIVFDRNGYQFHGRIKALAESIKKSGIEI